ncbi:MULTISPECIES: hypothetical protein [Clostridium]|uniref:hypothetical protein n=1 Tax=Clostridium TaxID=1485 RepID=UPI0025C3300E|nr:hypothetical protein [Clostridium sp.]MBS4958811.1 hypothetical protein [Clostridium sp.]MDU7362740.1 hypothetical protein [Clostridium sp.]
MQETIINAIVEGIKQSVVNFLKWIGLGIINGSYWICLIACLVAIILYIAGQRKAGKYVSISFVIYVVLQAIKGVLI